MISNEVVNFEFMEETEIEIVVDGENTFFSWNNDAIQDLSEELGEPEFPEPRPCG